MSIVEHFDLKPHCDSGYTLSASFLSQFRTTRANTFPTMLSKEIPLQLLHSLRFLLFQGNDATASHVLGKVPLLPALTDQSVEVFKEWFLCTPDDFCWDYIQPWCFACG